MASAQRCPICGRLLSEHDRHVRFALPDPVLELPERDTTPGTWMSHASARESVMMQVPGIGAFVRALLPVHLTDDDSVTFGVWLGIDPRDDALRGLADVWWDDTRYADLRLDAVLANRVPPWQLLALPVTAEVRSVAETPYCVASSDDTVARVLSDMWDRDEVLSTIGRA